MREEEEEDIVVKVVLGSRGALVGPIAMIAAW